MALKDTHAGERERAAERRPKTLALRQTGLSYRAIADQLGISQSQAYKDVQRSLADLLKLEHLEMAELRRLELERLDMLMQAATPGVEIGSAPHILAFLKVSESRRKLLGLDAPLKIDLHLFSTVNEIVRLIEAGGADASMVFNRMLERLHDQHQPDDDE